MHKLVGSLCDSFGDLHSRPKQVILNRNAYFTQDGEMPKLMGGMEHSIPIKHFTILATRTILRNEG